MVAEIVTMCARIYFAKEALEKGFAILVCAVFCAVMADILYRLLKQDDDDWFGDQKKKFKRWIKNILTARRPRPAFAV